MSRNRRIFVALTVILGLALTGLSVHRVNAKPGVYWGEVRVLFLAPTSAVNPNALTTDAGGLIPVAGAVARMVVPDVSDARVVSPSVSIVDQGIRRGYSVTLPNDGGQWADNYDQALLDVQVAGPTLAGVSATMSRLVSQINASLILIQDRAHVAKVNRIHTSLNPGQPQFYYLRGRPHRAVIATVLLGLGLTFAAAGWVSRTFRRQQRTRIDSSIGGQR